jgi:hypothetical protein
LSTYNDLTTSFNNVTFADTYGISGQGPFTISGNVMIVGGTVEVFTPTTTIVGSITIATDAHLEVSAQNGTMEVEGPAVVQSGASVIVRPTATLQIDGRRRGGGSSISGSFSVEAGATLTFAGGTFTLDAASSVSGAGTVNFTNGTANVAGTYNVTGATIISGGTANFSGGGTVNATTLTLSNGALTGGDTVTVSGLLTWTGGTISGGGVTNAQGGMQIGNSNYKTLDGRTLNNAGTASSSDTYGIFASNGAIFNNLATATWDIQSDEALAWGFGAAPTFNNAGTFRKSGGTSTTGISVPFNNTGTVDVQTGTLRLNGAFPNFANMTLTGGTYVVGGIFQFTNADIRTNAASIIVNGPNAAIINQSGANALANFSINTADGSVTIQNGQNLTTSVGFQNAGNITIGADSLFNAIGGYTQTSGTTNVNGGTLAAGTIVDLQGGILSGTGSINGNVQNAGLIEVGGAGSAGLLTIKGDYAQTAKGNLNLELGSLDSGEFDQLQITGTANLDGTLNVTLLDSFLAREGDAFQVLTFGSRTGTFASVNLPDLGSYFLDPVFDDSSLSLWTRHS